MPTPPHSVARPLDDPTHLGLAVDELLANRCVTLLALGEPTHGIEAFPLLRNDMLAHLVDRGYRSVALESDYFTAPVVDDYVCGSSGALDEVLAAGFSHGFGAVPGNRELVEWMRTYNADRSERDRIRFYGFDAPVEYAGAPSPRRALKHVIDHLSTALRPTEVDAIDELVGEEADWTNPAAMYEASASIGKSERAHALRIVADELVGTLRRAPLPNDRMADAHARTALGLLDYHEAMAAPGPDRIDRLLGVRAHMMADNLLDIAAAEQERGPTLVFAHNSHLHRVPSDGSWANAGALVTRALGDRYVFIATDANPRSRPGTLQGTLADNTARRALFPMPELRDALPSSIEAGEPILPGHIPLTPQDLVGTDAVVFIADTDGVRHEYW